MEVVEIQLLSSGGIDGAASAALSQADVIIGVDAATQREFTVFGCPSLESTTSLKRPSAMRTVRVSIDYRAGELETLLQWVRAVKGRSDYDGADA